jgi:hypothetical protein
MDEYAVEGVNWMLPYGDPELWVTGRGVYQIGSPDASPVLQHRLELDLKVTGDPVQHFDSGLVDVGDSSGISITVSIHGKYCFDTAIHIDASEVPSSEVISYQLLSDSTFQRGCFDPCDCPLEVERDLLGYFDLIPLADNSLFRTFALANLTWQVITGSATGDNLPIQGVGMYSVGGEFAVQHRLSLELEVGDDSTTHYDSGWVIGGTVFPKLLALVSINGIRCYDTMMQVSAEPKSMGISTDPCVKVVLDMDGSMPGFQSNVNVPAGTSVVRDVAVYVLDPSASYFLWGIGYLGGLDRGIAFGHTPDNSANGGYVLGLEAHPGAPVHPENTQLIFPAMDKGFEGVEIQYVEISATQPAAIPANPSEPILRADVQLHGAQAGDVFDFYLLDFVSVWTGGGGGAFSTTGAKTLDSGGDAIPDGTQTAMGVDPDGPVAVPPGSFCVDYLDGPAGGGPATITVIAGPNPIPTVSELGACVMSALILAAGGFVLHHRRQSCQASLSG